MKANNFKNLNNKAILLIGIVVALVLSFILATLTSPKKKTEKDVASAMGIISTEDEKPTVDEKSFKTFMNNLRKETEGEVKIAGLDLSVLKEGSSAKEEKKEEAPKTEEKKDPKIETKEEVDSNGNTVKATYVDGVAQGEVTITYKNGEYEIANYKDGVLDGKTTYHFNNGDKEVANYKNGVLDGDATYYFKDGSTTKYSYKNGNKVE